MVAWVVVNALLLAPTWLAGAVLGGSGAVRPWVALESALVVGVLAALPRSLWSRALAGAAAVALVAVTVVGLSDLVFRVSLGRPLNLFLDLYLVDAVWNLAAGNMGLPKATAAGAGLLLVAALASFALARLLAPGGAPRGLVTRLAGLALVALFAAGLNTEPPDLLRERVATPTVRLAAEQGALLLETRLERGRFEDEMATPDSHEGTPGLLSRLEGRDVLLTFIESYGMAALDDPEFAAVVRPRLDSLEVRAAAAGLHLVSGTLTSPTRGGQSWYAHGTAISGLWLSNQLRYELLLASDRETLVDDFRHAGYRTAVLMPAITMAWPDAVQLGYDEVHTAENIRYGGPPLYWVTMPDQFTWSYLHRTVRRGDGRPQFVETGMVSSHAPWTPILPMVDWDAIGDGSAFEPYRQEGHPPEELWWDVDQLRRQYAHSLDYSLQAMAEYAERYLDERTLLVVMGDHQAAPWVTGDASADVPVHVFATDPAVLEPFRRWGFRDGAFPDPRQEPHRMDEFRGWFVRAYSGPEDSDS